MKNIPELVKATAKSLIDMYGENFSYLGMYDGAEAYVYEFPKDSCTGFPFVYLLKDDIVTEASGYIALHIIDLAAKDPSE